MKTNIIFRLRSIAGGSGPCQLNIEDRKLNIYGFASLSLFILGGLLLASFCILAG
jgi:hypothetical protein